VSPLEHATSATRPTDEDVRSWAAREAEIDREGMRDRVAGLPTQLVAGAGRALPLAEGLIPGRPPRALALAGMGGSAIAGELVAGWSAERRRLPLAVVRDYAPPAWLDGDAFLIASSYSGETAETVACYAAAKARGIPAAVVTTGGRLARLAAENGDPVFVLPPGSPPRAALGHSLAACALVVAALDPGLQPGPVADELRAAGEAVSRDMPEWLEWAASNPAVGLAETFARRVAVIYGGHPIARAAATRWRCQIAENAKRLAFSSEFPERDHNEIVGFEGDVPPALAQVFLETTWDDPRVRRRIDLAWESGVEAGLAPHRVRVGGETALEGLFRLCCLGDCASFLASVIAGHDPTPVRSIERLKARLGDSGDVR